MIDNTVYFDDTRGETRRYLTRWKDRLNNLDYDMCIVVVGRERGGKSTLSGQIADFISGPKFEVKHWCMDGKEYLAMLKCAVRGGSQILDEGGTAMYSREAMSPMNKVLSKSFMVSGLLNIAQIIALPNFFFLDKTIRMHRIDLLIYCKERGKFWAWSKTRAKLISIKGAKNMNIECGVKPNIKGWFTKQLPERLEKEYRLKERKFKLAFLKDTGAMLEGYYTVGKFCEITGFNSQVVLRWVRSGRIEARKYGARYMIPKGEVDRLDTSLLKGKALHKTEEAET